MTDEIPRRPNAKVLDPDDLELEDRADAVVLTYKPVGEAATRLVFEPRDGAGARYDKYEQTRTEAGEWRPLGSEPVDTLVVEDDRDD